MNKTVAVLGLLFSSLCVASDLPARPSDPGHPASNKYLYQVERQKFQLLGRDVEVFLPAELKGSRSAPVMVYGHGQSIGLDGYEASFEHLARKGNVVVFPTFDTGFFDQQWRRMADDFNKMSAEALSRYSEWIDPSRVVYGGHSKGGYVALMAAGAPTRGRGPDALILFSPAGFDADYLSRLDTEIPVTLVWGVADSIIKKNAVEEIYRRAPSKYKQFIEVQSYPSLAADHFFVLSKAFFFGGKNGLSPFHYFGSWKWMQGALDSGRNTDSAYLYGSETASSGVDGLSHKVTKSW